MSELFSMEHLLTPEQMLIRESVGKICANFDDDYWLNCDRNKIFPEDFIKALADNGWLGLTTPVEYGGAGLSVTDAAVVSLTISESGAGPNGATPSIMSVFGMHPVIKHGTEEQKQRMLPPVLKREDINCFGVTEPNTGLDTTRLKTFAKKNGDHYIVNGQKLWTTTAQQANKILLIARTKTIEETSRPIDGLSLFYTDLDRDYVEVRRIPKMGGEAVDSNQLFIDGLPVPEADRIGEEGKGFYYLLDGLNPERIVIAALCVGLGRLALTKAVSYAKERIVFDRPIGMNQGIQHPLAECWTELEAAMLMVMKAAELYDKGEPCGHIANAAKYLASEAAFKTCTAAVMTHGGMGYAKEFHVERYLRDSVRVRLAPISMQLILCHISERVLGLPKSY